MIPELSSVFRNSVWPALANHLWQSTVVLCVAGLLTLVLRKNHARTRYWLWMTASMKFLVPWALLIGLGSQIHIAEPRMTGSAPAAGIYTAMDHAGQPFSQPMVIPPVIARQSSLHDVLFLLPVAVWLCGAIVILALWLVRWRRMARVVREAVPADEGREAEILRRVTARAGLSGPVPLRLSRGRMEPGVFGIRRPVLLWPEAISEHLDDAHIEAIMAHELQHVRRRDNLAAALHMAVEAVFWFHPLVWVAGTRLVEERERACDEDVMRAGGQPHVYAESILKTCQFCLEPPLRCVSGITGADLKRRVAQIMSKSGALKLDLGRKMLLAAVGCVAVIAPVVLGQMNAAQNAGQVEDKDVSFEVATIKPSSPSDDADGMSVNGRRFEILKGRVSYLMSFAYDIQARQIENAPSWLMTDKYDIQAVMPEGANSGQIKSEQIKGMVRRLLADRFGLKFHRERKEMVVYALTVGNGGAKLEASKPRVGANFIGRGMGHLYVLHGDMPGLARWFNGGILDRPVVDQTGLAGTYDFTLNWMPDDSQYGGMGGMMRPHADDANALPGLFTAIQEQIGLKLEPTKANVDMLAIDHVGRPSEN